MTQQSFIERNISLVFLVAVLCVAAPFALKPLATEIKFSHDWRSYFSGYQNLGENCRVALTPPYSESVGELEKLENGRKIAQPFKIPFRTEPTFKFVPDGYSSYVACRVIPRDTDRFTSPSLFLGPIWGKSNIYINGTSVRSVTDYAILTLPLSKDVASQPFELEILSEDVGRGVGPRSLIPFMLLPSEADLKVVHRTMNYSSTEKSLVPLGIAGTMMTLFFCCWIFGVRYRDVYWMIVTCAAATAAAGMLHFPDSDPPVWHTRVRLFIDMICWGALWAAIYTFLRKPAKQWQLVLSVLGLALIYQLQWEIPTDLRRQLIGGIERYDGVWLGPVLLYLAYLAFQIDSTIPKRRYLQRRALGVMLVVFGLWILWAGFYSFRYGLTTTTLTRTALIALFGTFMMIDLVIFQRAYFEEKSLKEEEERRRSALEDRVELGFSIQRLLMPTAQTKDFGSFRVHVFYECADLMAGDWFFWKESHGELRVLCGDVVGKGPQAAIAATSILTMCHNLSDLEDRMPRFLTRLNHSVSDIFQLKPISTLGAAAIGADGSIQVFNHGFAGWVHVKRNSVEMINQRGASLGTSFETVWDSQRVDLELGERILIFSDGVAEGPRALKRLCEGLEGTQAKSFEDITRIALDLGRSSVVEDDRTILMIERII